MKRLMKLILFLFATILAMSCDPVPTELSIDLYAQGAGFNGIFTIDGDNESTSFSSSETTSDLFLFDEDIEIDESIVIDVIPASSEDEDADDDETEMTALTCRIWSSDDQLLFEETYDIDSTNMKSFIYSLE